MVQDAPRFAIQRHDRDPDPHFDILLERGGALRTFSVKQPLGESEEARAIPDHRLLYLTYEGPISGGRGTVRLHDSGNYREESWKEDRISVRLDGKIHRGRLALTRIEGDRWQVEWRPEVGEPSGT
jgi:hypothetical protein